MTRKIVQNITVGKPQAKPTDPSHVKGVHEGNKKGNLEKMKGFERHDGKLEGNAKRSTGIAPDDSETIDPRMPKISPA